MANKPPLHVIYLLGDPDGVLGALGVREQMAILMKNTAVFPDFPDPSNERPGGDLPPDLWGLPSGRMASITLQDERFVGAKLCLVADPALYTTDPPIRLSQLEMSTGCTMVAVCVQKWQSLRDGSAGRCSSIKSPFESQD